MRSFEHNANAGDANAGEVTPRDGTPRFSLHPLVRQGPYLVAIALPILVMIALALARPRPLSDLSNIVFDAYQRADPRQWNPQAPVRIVNIDDASLARIGQWPWPRSTIADLVKRLGDLGAIAVAFDILFAEPDAKSAEQIVRALPETRARKALERKIASQPSNDTLLAGVLKKLPTVLGSVLNQGTNAVDYPAKFGVATVGDNPRPFLPHFTGALLPLPNLIAASAGIGALNWLPDHDQVVRRVPIVLALNDRVVASLAAETLRVVQNASTIVVRSSNASGQQGFGAHTGVNAVKIGDLEIPTSAQGELRLHFTATEPRRFIPAWQIMTGRGDLSDVKNRIIIIGVGAGGLSDQRATPINASVSGVEVQAQALEGLMAGGWLVRPDWAEGSERLLAVAIALITGFMLPRLSAIAAALGASATIVALGLTSWLEFSHARLLLDPILPILAVSLTYVCGAAWLFQSEQRQRRHVREAFGRFVSPEIVARLAEDPARLVLGGETKTLTVMFCDVRGFTSISERYDVQHLTHFMNEYFTPLTDTVLSHGGTVDKYIGDALMAFWNAPFETADHARQAARAALKMVEDLETLNARWREEAAARSDSHDDVRFGVGLATGECCVGNLGSTRRFDYSVLGDTVNLSSRIEGLTKAYQVDIIAAEATRDQSSDFAWLELDTVRVKGKMQETRIFYLAGDDVEARTPQFAALREHHARMLRASRDGNFDAAIALAQEAHEWAAPRHRELYDYFARKYREAADAIRCK
jgi:adenylate cyclase